MHAEVVFQHIVEIIRYGNLTSTAEISHQTYFLMKFLADVTCLPSLALMPAFLMNLLKMLLRFFFIVL